MNEEAKRSMIEWQEKLDKVTKDSNERITELQQKLTKVSNAPTKTFLACLRGTAHLSARDVHQHAQTFNLSGGAKRSASTLSCSWYLLLELWRKWAHKTKDKGPGKGVSWDRVQFTIWPFLLKWNKENMPHINLITEVFLFSPYSQTKRQLNC